MSQTAGSRQGYVLFAPLHSKTTYLIDKCGKLVHSWTSEHTPAQSVYLLPNGNLLRTGTDSSRLIPANGGKIELFDWNNKRLWHYTIANAVERQHHDICPMPNGNVLVVAYRRRSKDEALAAGRDLASAGESVLGEKIIELQPILGTDSAKVVWEWDVWDHLVQDRDTTKPHYGKIADNPQLININYLDALGEDWLHFNSVAYNAELDQIMVSNHHFSELYILDHSTTTAQAASHSGGKYGRGGDILYRWGNPVTYNRGTNNDQKLFSQHHPHWIEKGKPDAGKILIFNNGMNRPGEAYSTVDIIEPPMDKNGNYISAADKPFGPAQAYWSYMAPNATRFFSKNISGAQRLANGNTLVCSGSTGKFFELDPNKQVVWTYISPVGTEPITQGVKTNGQAFRCTFYEPSYPAFKGRKLVPGAPIEANPGTYPCMME